MKNIPKRFFSWTRKDVKGFFREGGCFKSFLLFFFFMLVVASICIMDYLPGLVVVLVFCVSVFMYIIGYWSGYYDAEH